MHCPENQVAASLRDNQDGEYCRRFTSLLMCSITYQIEFFNARVYSAIQEWSIGIVTSFTSTAGRGANMGTIWIRAKGGESIERVLFYALVGQPV